MYGLFNKSGPRPAKGPWPISLIRSSTDAQRPPRPDHMLSKPLPEPEPTKQAPTPRTYLERIPVTGLYNYLQAEHGSLEGYFWLLILLLATAATLRYTIPCITEYVKFTTVVELRHPSEPKLPFPIVYVGMIDAINGTYFLNRYAEITPQLVADKRMQHLARSVGTDVPGLVWYTVMSITASPFWDLSWMRKEIMPVVHETVYRSVLAYGKNWTGIRTYYEEGMYKCPNVLRNCKLNGLDFPCCHDSANGYSADVNVFFKMNMSSIFGDTAMSSLYEESYVTFDSTIDTRYALAQRTEYPSLALTFGNTLTTTFDCDGVPLPSGSTAYVKVRSRRRMRLDKCIDRYQYRDKDHKRIHVELQEYIKNMTDPVKYSTEKCLFTKMLEMMSQACGCVVPYDTLRPPNDTSICTPAHLYVCFHGVLESDLKVPVSHGPIKDIWSRLKEEAAECLPLCDALAYDIHTTFVPLLGSQGSNSSIIYNKVIITVDPDYRLESDVLKISGAAFLGTLGDGLALFMGFSFIAFVQCAYWIVAAAALRKRRNKVAPSMAQGVEPQ